MNRHLSSDQFSEWLIGQRTRELERHLSESSECAAELRRIEEPIALFRGALSEWSAGRNTPPQRVPMQAPGIFAAQIQTWIQTSIQTWMRITIPVALLAVIILIGIEGRSRRATAVAHDDNALLEQVQAEVMRPVPVPMQRLYKLTWEETAQ